MGRALKLPHGHVQQIKIRLRIENWEGCGTKWSWHYSYISLGEGEGGGERTLRNSTWTAGLPYRIRLAY
jgi:hypothetical protein